MPKRTRRGALLQVQLANERSSERELRCMGEKISTLPRTAATNARMFERGTLAKYFESLARIGCQLVARRCVTRQRSARARARFQPRLNCAQGGGQNTPKTVSHHA